MSLLLIIGLLDGLVWSEAALAKASGPGREDTVKQIMSVQKKQELANQEIKRELLLAKQGQVSERAARKQNIITLRENRFIYQRQLNVLKKEMMLSAETVKLRQNIKSGQAFLLTEKKPYSLVYYDRLLDGLAKIRLKNDILRMSMKNTAQEIEQGRKKLETAEAAWRRVKENVESRKGAAAENDLQYIRAQLDRQAAGAALELQKLNYDALKKEMIIAGLKQKAAAHKLETARKDISFDRAALKQEIARLTKQKEDLNKRVQSVLDARKKLEPDWQGSPLTSDSLDVDASIFKVREAWQQTYERVLQETEEMTQLLNTQMRLWKFRYNILKTGDVAQKDLDLWQKEAATVQRQVQQAIGLYQDWQLDLQFRIASLKKEQSGMDSTRKKYMSYRLDALRKSRESGRGYLSMLLTTGRLSNRLLDEITVRAKNISIWQKVLTTGDKFNDFWNFELWVIDDSGVTVRKAVTALFILILGILVVNRSIRLLSVRLKRANMEMSSAAAVEKLLLYLGYLFVVLFALHMVRIPLTAFTFLGGAVAIGVGFGAQNLINNFISGFIIMAERPIRIGDLIEMESKSGQVEEIGARCTKIKTEENIHILVPNSSFLEKNITNWTLSDKKVCSKVVVGVAYGSSVDKVTELLLEAAAKSEGVVQGSKSFVIFDNFGSNALIFETYFWTIVEGITERKKIASNVRYRINELFAMNGIVIAYPQCDVHLDSPGFAQAQMLESS